MRVFLAYKTVPSSARSAFYLLALSQERPLISSRRLFFFPLWYLNPNPNFWLERVLLLYKVARLLQLLYC